MALYAMSDLHLSLASDKPMDVFGEVWHDYTDKIYHGWNSVVSEDDLVIVGGDISWAMYLEEAYADLKFLNSLSGKKIIMRGNHDYWWESISKIKKFLGINGFNSIDILQNNSFIYEDFSISGSRGWILPSSEAFGANDRKVYERELIRLTLSLDDAARLESLYPEKKFKKIVVMHYPPSDVVGRVDSGYETLFKKYGVNTCVYGHLHDQSVILLNSFDIGTTHCKLVSSDYLGFKPIRLI